MTDRDIAKAVASDPDAAPLDAAFWRNARVVVPDGKERVTMHIDRRVLAWFRSGGKRYQTRINAVLRAYVEAQQDRTHKT